jgi:hypothetical protein
MDGLVYLFCPKLVGSNYLPLKAMLIVMTGESLIYNIFGVLGRDERLTLNVSGNFVHAFAAAIGGLLGGFLTQRFFFPKNASRKGEKMNCNKPLLAMLFGIAPLPLLEGFIQIMKHLGLTTLSVFEVLSLMWLKKPSWLLGILAMFGIGAWIGLLIYQSSKILGIDYFPLKAIVIEVTSVFLIFSLFGTLGRNELIIQNAGGAFVHLFAAIIGGIGTGFLMKMYLFNRY